MASREAEMRRIMNTFLQAHNWIADQLARGNSRPAVTFIGDARSVQEKMDAVKIDQRNMGKTWPSSVSEWRASRVTMGSQLPN